MTKTWKRLYDTLIIDAYRTGWIGAWDAFKAALLCRDRLQVTETVTFSMYAKVVDPDGVEVWGAQLEKGQSWEV